MPNDFIFYSVVNAIGRGVWGSIAGSVKTDTVSSTARHRYDASSCLCCQALSPATRYTLQRSIATHEYDEDLMLQIFPTQFSWF